MGDPGSEVSSGLGPALCRVRGMLGRTWGLGGLGGLGSLGGLGPRRPGGLGAWAWGAWGLEPGGLGAWGSGGLESGAWGPSGPWGEGPAATMAARPGSGTAARRGRGVGSEADCLLEERAPCSSGRWDAEGPLRSTDASSGSRRLGLR